MTTALILARRVQPAAFALTLACITIALSWWGFDRIPGPWEQIVAVSMAGIALWLTAGWIANSQRMMRWGLLAAAFTWVYVSLIAWLSISRAPANWLTALAWAALAAGSYWLEQADYIATVRGRGGP